MRRPDARLAGKPRRDWAPPESGVYHRREGGHADRVVFRTSDDSGWTVGLLMDSMRVARPAPDKRVVDIFTPQGKVQSGAPLDMVLRMTRPARRDEILPLAREMARMGYRPEPIAITEPTRPRGHARRDPERARRIALQAEEHVAALTRATYQNARPGGTRPADWHPVADALEVAADAWRAAGDERRAAAVDIRLSNLLGLMRGPYEVVESPELFHVVAPRRGAGGPALARRLAIAVEQSKRYQQAVRQRRARTRRDPDEALLKRAWAADAHAKQVHTYEAWMVAADAFEEAGRPDIAARLRAETAHLRKNWPRRELLHVAIAAADRALAGKRPSEKLFAKARSAAFDAIRRADRLAGTDHHKTLRNSADIARLAHRGVELARRLNWTPRALEPAWASRLLHRRRAEDVDLVVLGAR